MKRLSFAIGFVLAAISVSYAQFATYTTSNVYPSSTFASLPSAPTNTGYIYNVTDVGVNGSLWRSNGTLWAPVNGSVVLVQNAMPWILLSTGSISAGGALTGITALAYNPGKAWVYLPANALAASIAAGWYYAVFSSTTAATIYLNQPAATFPVVWPASPTAVTAGQGAYVGAGAANHALPTFSLPANSMGINGQLSASGNSAGGTTSYVYFFLSASQYGSASIIGASQAWRFDFRNRGVTNLQQASSYELSVSASVNQTQFSNLALDTTSAQNPYVSLYTASAIVNGFLDGFTVTLYNDGQ